MGPKVLSGSHKVGRAQPKTSSRPRSTMANYNAPERVNPKQSMSYDGEPVRRERLAGKSRRSISISGVRFSTIFGVFGTGWPNSVSEMRLHDSVSPNIVGKKTPSWRVARMLPECLQVSRAPKKERGQGQSPPLFWALVVG